MTTCVGGLLCEADRSVQLWLQSPALQQNALLQGLAGVFNWWGGPGVIWFGALLWLVSRAARRCDLARVGLRSIEALAVASAINGITKGLVGRQRPFVAPGEPWHFNMLHGWTDAHFQSLPSGHTTATFAFAVAACVVTRGWPRASRTLYGGVLLLSAFAVAFARAYTDQHWFSDVLAGVLIGGSTGWLLARWHVRRGETAFDRALAGRKTPA
jgi:membrane-associated phospholipid phosphatase